MLNCSRISRYVPGYFGSLTSVCRVTETADVCKAEYEQLDEGEFVLPFFASVTVQHDPVDGDEDGARDDSAPVPGNSVVADETLFFPDLVDVLVEVQSEYLKSVNSERALDLQRFSSQSYTYPVLGGSWFWNVPA